MSNMISFPLPNNVLIDAQYDYQKNVLHVLDRGASSGYTFHDVVFEYSDCILNKMHIDRRVVAYIVSYSPSTSGLVIRDINGVTYEDSHINVTGVIEEYKNIYINRLKKFL